MSRGAVWLAAICAVLSAACARMGSPDGGWYDETPPKVVSATPADKSTGAKTGRVKITFSENVKLENASEKVVVSPPQLEAPDIRAAGRAVTVQLNDSLKPNTTYTVDFSDAISDNNEGNPLGNYTYSFSTGEEIDTMEVAGYVLEAADLEPVKGILVGLYGDMEDSAFSKKPMQRVSRTDSRGFFSIKGVAPGKWRVYALQDMDGDYEFSQKGEKMAFTEEVAEPWSKPDIRQDTLWLDSLRIADITRVPYTHFMPDDIVLRAFSHEITDRYLVKSERVKADRFTLYFSYGHGETPVVRGFNFNAEETLLTHRSERGDTVTCWIKDTAIVNTDTLEMAVSYHATDSTGTLQSRTDTITLISKDTYAKRMKALEKKREDWAKQAEKAKRRGEPYDSIMPPEPLELKITPSGAFAPDQNISVETPTPMARVDTAGIHLYVKRDTLWYRARYEIDSIGPCMRRLRAEWRPGQEYSLEMDSAAVADIYGVACKALKNGFGIKNTDEFSSLLVTIAGEAAAGAVVQLMDSGDKPVKTAKAKGGLAEFYYVTPGEYFLRMYQDLDGDGEWDTGNFAEGRQPEPVYYYPGAVTCKAKWDVRETWNPTAKPLFSQKPGKITKQKAEKQKKKMQRNAQRAKDLGIEYVRKNAVK